MPLIGIDQYNDLRSNLTLFPLISIISAIILISGNIYLQYALSSSFSNLSNLTLSQVNSLRSEFSFIMSIYLSLISISTIIYAIGVYYLRKGYKVLAVRNRKFNPPKAGGTLALMGFFSLTLSLLIIAAISGALFSSFFSNINGSTYKFSISTPDYDILFLAGGMAVFALILIFLGTISYLYFGTIRLAREFQDYYFLIAFFLFLADIIISSVLGSLSYIIFPSSSISAGVSTNNPSSLFSFQKTGFNSADILISIIALIVFISPNIALLMGLRKEKLLKLKFIGN
ncbi:MAG: hypothetical protein ACYDAO_05590 [Thermoplasmataceae archaeon]